MNEDIKGLSELRVGEACRVVGINAVDSVRQRLADIGIALGAELSCVGISPLGDPRAYLSLGGVFAIRNRDAAAVRVKVLPACEERWR